MAGQGNLGFTETKEDIGPVECLGQAFESDEARREHYLELLAEKLKDSEFRKTPGFPKGTDEAILRLSDPPYYTACPNPFVEQALSILSEAQRDELERPMHPLGRDVTGGKNDPIYNAHPYHTKVPPSVIEEYVEHFTTPGDVVLDMFAGSGMTGVACQNAKSGERVALLFDISTVATHIAAGFNAPVADNIESMILEMIDQVQEDLGWMYLTRVEDQTADIEFLLRSQVLGCPDCDAEYVFWNVAYQRSSSEFLKKYKCPNCDAVIDKRASRLIYESRADPVARTVRKFLKYVPVLIRYRTLTERGWKAVDKADLQLLRRIEGAGTVDWFPRETMMESEQPWNRWGDKWRAGTSAFQYVHEFYEARTLKALARFMSIANANPGTLMGRWVFTAAHQYTNRMCRLHVSNFVKGGGGLVDKPLGGTLYLPSLSIETNAIRRLKLRSRVQKVLSLRRGTCFISTASATNLHGVNDNSVDYIFTDPPFGENLAYSELNFGWESWLGVKTNNMLEAIVSKHSRKGLHDYEQLMTSALREAYRVLKPGGWVTIVFHNSKNTVWNAIQQGISASGFVIADVRLLSKGKGSSNAVNMAGAMDKDLAISAYKPSESITRIGRQTHESSQSVWRFVTDLLAHLPVFNTKASVGYTVEARTGRLLYDRMLAFYVQRGVLVPISASEFLAGLDERYSKRDGMYFLQGQMSEYDRQRTTVGELRQLTLFVSDEASATRWIRQQLQAKPQSFQDLQPQFMQQLQSQSWEKHEKTIELKEILELNFFCYNGTGPVPSQIKSYLSTNFKDMRNLEQDNPRLQAKAKDRWYVPNPNKEGDLEKLRLRTLLKEFEEYRNNTSRKIKQFRTEAVRVGFKHCYDQGDYATLVAVAAKLPEKVIQEDEKLLMYYDVATMRLGD
jgi:DNA modification methylase